MNETWWVGPEQLNEEQRAVIALPLEGSHLIVGPPGSGKTNLLLLRANYMTLAGQPNIMVIVFTRTLHEFIVSGATQYAFPPSKVRTCRRWEQDFLREYGIKAEPPDDFEEQRLYFIGQLQSLIRKRKLSEVYDAILLDEAQDYLPNEIQIFKQLSKVLFAVADHRQKIYKVKDCMDTLDKSVDKRHALRYHYRIGTNICRLADALTKDSADHTPLLPTSNYDEETRPSSVEHIRCQDLDEQSQKIIERISVQLRAYPGESVGVISPTNEATMHIWKQIEESDLAPFAALHVSGEDGPFEPDKPVCVCTLHRVKGLEFRALHIAGFEFLKKFPYQRNMAYTAVTRSKTSLSLYYSDDLPGYVEQALNVLNPLPNLPKLEAVFGKKK